MNQGNRSHHELFDTSHSSAYTQQYGLCLANFTETSGCQTRCLYHTYTYISIIFRYQKQTVNVTILVVSRLLFSSSFVFFIATFVNYLRAMQYWTPRYPRHFWPQTAGYAMR
jgi:hypothetical protein